MLSFREILLIAAVIAVVYVFGRLMKRRSDLMVKKKQPNSIPPGTLVGGSAVPPVKIPTQSGSDTCRVEGC